MPSFLGDTWTCHVCGRERPDEKISVANHERINGVGVHVRQNVRFCNDGDQCRRVAMVSDHAALAERRTALAHGKLLSQVDDLTGSYRRLVILVAEATFLLAFLLGVVIGRFVI